MCKFFSAACGERERRKSMGSAHHPPDCVPLHPLLKQNRSNEMPTAHVTNENLVVGVDLGGTQIRTAVLRGAQLISRVGLPTGEDTTPERLIPRISTAIEQAL